MLCKYFGTGLIGWWMNSEEYIYIYIYITRCGETYLICTLCFFLQNVAVTTEDVCLSVEKLVARFYCIVAIFLFCHS